MLKFDQAQRAPARVLVVDDSAFMRKMVTEIVRRGGMEVVGAAQDGVVALELAKKLQPDAITLDVEMPRMDGVAFLTQLMKECPTPVVMLSSKTAQGTETAIRCLELGAFACLEKPSGSISLDIEKIEAAIIETVRHASQVDKQRLRPRASSPVASQRVVSLPTVADAGADVPRAPISGKPKCIVAIASSTGGPSALQQVIPRLPGNLGAALVLVQHLPVGFTQSLAKRLNDCSAITVKEAREGSSIRANELVVAPAGRHLEIDRNGRVVLNDQPTIWGVRPAADIMMTSVAEHFGSAVIGVVLTGMGRDGALGAKAVRNHGGTCIGQDEESCVIYGMPRAAVEAGGIDRVLPIHKVADGIVEAVERLRSRAA